MFEVISDQKTWVDACDVELCSSDVEMDTIFDEAENLKAVGLDWETTSLNVEKAKLVGLAISLSASKARYIPVGHQVGAELNLSMSKLKTRLTKLDAIPTCRQIWFNFKYDGEVTWQQMGLELEQIEDVMLAAFLENSDQKDLRLDSCAKRYLGDATKLSFTQTTGGKTFDYVHPKDAVRYACVDALLNIRLWESKPIQATVAEQRFIYALEKKVTPVLREGERARTFLCLATLERLAAEVIRQVDTLERRIYELAGGEFKIGSDVALGKKLIDLGVPIEEKTKKTKQPETGKDVLKKYVKYHPIIKLVIMWKELTTQKRNYIDKMISAVERFGPAVKFPFHQYGVPTGRMRAGGEGKKEEAYDKGVINVNVQSTPDAEKEDYLPDIRSAITANDMTKSSRDFVLVSIDYSQVELRITANLSREPTWIKTFSTNGDIHASNARFAFRDNTIPDHSDHPKRKAAKPLGFAILYGGNEYTVARQGNIPIERATAMVENFFGSARTLKTWIDGWIAMARRQKRIKTYFGRVRHLEQYYASDAPRWLKNKGDREAINDPIQGAAADIMKIAMVKVRKLTRERNWKQDAQQIIWVHDETVLRVRRSMLEEIVPELVKAMEFVIKGWPVNLKVDVKIGWNWGARGSMISYDNWIKEPLPDLSIDSLVDDSDGEESTRVEMSADGWR